MEREFFIGLDYNLSAIKQNMRRFRATIHILDKFHYPAPGYKQTKGGSFILNGSC